MVKKIKELPIVWDIEEKERFKSLMKGIKERSEPLANRIKVRLKENLQLIKSNPYTFEADRLKIQNDGTYRKFTAVRIRVIYKIETGLIIIARIRHAASEPEEY